MQTQDKTLGNLG